MTVSHVGSAVNQDITRLGTIPLIGRERAIDVVPVCHVSPYALIVYRTNAHGRRTMTPAVALTASSIYPLISCFVPRVVYRVGTAWISDASRMSDSSYWPAFSLKR